jgi:hypothetical protein
MGVPLSPKSRAGASQSVGHAFNSSLELDKVLVTVLEELRSLKHFHREPVRLLRDT